MKDRSNAEILKARRHLSRNSVGFITMVIAIIQTEVKRELIPVVNIFTDIVMR